MLGLRVHFCVVTGDGYHKEPGGRVILEIYKPHLVTLRLALIKILLLNKAHAGRRAPGFLTLLLSGKSVCMCVCVRPQGYK